MCIFMGMIDWKIRLFVIYYQAVKCRNEEKNIAVTYKKLFYLLTDFSASELTEQAGYSANIFTRLRQYPWIAWKKFI